MIVCDICRKPADYCISVNYRGQKDFSAQDLCEFHYNELQEFLRKEDKRPKRANKTAKIG